MNTFQTNYQALVSDESEAHAESLVIHVASEGSKSRWNHIDDLDSFFQKVYKFHQKYGFICIMGEEFVNLAMFMIIALFIVYCMRCIYFDFDAPTSPLVNKTDIQLADLFIPVSDCFISFNGWMWFIFLIVLVQIFVRLYKFFQTYISFKEIEQFYETALKIPKAEVHNVTWHEIQCKLREVQHEQQMCVYKSDLSELDIYHRILRKENYKVALINKGILPVKFKVKFLGDWIYFSSALEKNLDFLLFGYFSPFKTTGTLKEDYKKYSKRKEMAAQLAKWFLVFGVANLICSPIIFAWQFFSFFITYSGIVRYEPSFLGMRRWSSYSKLYFRHFNELDHELSSRLNRAYKPAQEYMKSFSSPLGAIIFNFCRQISGGIAVFFFVWGMFTESLMLMDHVLLLIAAGSALFYIFSAMVPDENAVFSPKQLMQKIIAEIHYVPDHFKTMAHTTTVRDEFSQFFQYKVIFLLEELFSPIVTPLILIFHLRHRALDIVDFFRCFTVDVAGVGDVCSFALMDVSKHGNQDWVGPQNTKADQIQQAEDGKTELSLIHFKLMNPYWKPPNPSVKFIDEFRDQVSSSRAAAGVVNPYYSSLNSISTMGSKYASLVNSIHQTMHPHTGSSGFKSSIYTKEHEHMNGGLTRAEGPPFLVQDGVLSSLPENVDGNCLIPPDLNPMEFRAVDMSLSALFLHEVHDKYKNTARTLLPGTLDESSYSGENAGNEEAPLLDIKRTYVN